MNAVKFKNRLITAKNRRLPSIENGIETERRDAYDELPNTSLKPKTPLSVTAS